MNFMFSWQEREILFLPLEHKIHIFSPPCNILYLSYFAGELNGPAHNSCPIKFERDRNYPEVSLWYFIILRHCHSFLLAMVTVRPIESAGHVKFKAPAK